MTVCFVQGNGEKGRLVRRERDGVHDGKPWPDGDGRKAIAGRYE